VRFGLFPCGFSPSFLRPSLFCQQQPDPAPIEDRDRDHDYGQQQHGEAHSAHIVGAVVAGLIGQQIDRDLDRVSRGAEDIGRGSAVIMVTRINDGSRIGFRNMLPATTTAVPLQGDRLSRPARHPGCQPNAGPQRLGGGTPRSSGSCAQPRARPSFSCLTAAPEAEARGRLGTQSRAPHAGLCTLTPGALGSGADDWKRSVWKSEPILRPCLYKIAHNARGRSAMCRRHSLSRQPAGHQPFLGIAAGALSEPGTQ
jgi:hypothetical protein